MAWADLPARCLVRVLRHLLNFRDRVVFSVVCRRWRAAAQSYPLPPRLPWLVMPSTAATTFFSLASRDTRPLRLPIFARGARLCGSFPGGWLFADSRKTRDDNYALFNLLTGVVVGVPGDLLTDGPLGEEELPVHMHAAAFSAAPSAPSYHVAAILSGESPIAFWRPDETHWLPPRLTTAPFDESWRGLLPVGRIEDVMYHTGKLCEGFHVLTENEELLVYKPETNADGALTTSLASYDFGRHQACRPVGLGHGHTIARYLVETHGNLLMVARVVSPQQRTVAFGVFVLDYNNLLRGSSSSHSSTCISAAWRNATLSDLSGLKIILGRGCSVAFEAMDSSPLGICFLDDDSLLLGGPYPCGDTGVGLPVDRRIVRHLPQVPGSSDCSPWIWFFPWEATFRSDGGHLPAAVVADNFSEAQADIETPM